MPVRIQNIQVQKLGPIDRFIMKPGQFNLIYGRNEAGKTHLVEFLIRTLFRNVRNWSLRSTGGQGKITIQGLESKSSVFSPSSRKKMDDFWEESGAGLPPDLSRLLIVKGAELELSPSDGGVDRMVLKQYLSGQGVLDHIEKNISPSIRRCDISSGKIIPGIKKGELEKLEDSINELSRLNEIFNRIDDNYSAGRRQVVSQEIQVLRDRLKQQDLAKQHLAWQLSQEIQKLEQSKNRYDEEKIRQLREDVYLYKKKQDESRRKREVLQKVREASKYYSWLKQAELVYEKNLSDVAIKSNPLFLILTSIMAIAAGVCLYFQIAPGTAGALVGVILFGYFHFRRIMKTAKTVVKSHEMIELKKTFQKKVGKPLTGLPDLRESIQNIEDAYNEANFLEQQLKDEGQSLDELKFQIESRISRFITNEVEDLDWDAVLNNVETSIQQIQIHIREKRDQLAPLDVDPSDYISDNQDVEYNKIEYKNIKIRLEKLNTELAAEEEKLNFLKRDIYNATGNQPAKDWDNLIQNLREKREAVLAEYKNLVAEIIGKRLLFDVIQDLRKDEDKNILEGLNSVAEGSLLNGITGRYESFHLDGDALFVSDAYQDFPLADLSTGAQEQVLLALRIGFATRLLGKEGDTLFLVLDDAFQYSDWDRREKLMDATVQLAKNGWQIFYFSMDDHIRELFDKRGKQFGKDYVSVSL